MALTCGDVKARVATIHKLYNDDMFSEAVKNLRSLSDLMAKKKSNNSTSAADSRNTYAAMVSKDPVLREVEQMGCEMFDLVASLAPNTFGGGGWTSMSEVSEGDMTWYRDEGGGKQSFRCQGFIEAPVINLASLIYELDLWPTWFPGIVEASKYAELSKFRIVPLLQSWLPWPMANRSLRLKAYGDVFNGDSVAVYARDLMPSDLTSSKFEMPSSPEGNVDIELYFAGFHLIPLSKNVTYLKAIFCLDPKLAALPVSVFNLIVSKTCGILLKVIRANVTAEKMKGSEYERRMKTTPAYIEMRKRLATISYGDNAQKYLGKEHQDAFKSMSLGKSDAAARTATAVGPTS